MDEVGEFVSIQDNISLCPSAIVLSFLCKEPIFATCEVLGADLGSFGSIEKFFSLKILHAEMDDFYLVFGSNPLLTKHRVIAHSASAKERGQATFPLLLCNSVADVPHDLRMRTKYVTNNLEVLQSPLIQLN